MLTCRLNFKNFPAFLIFVNILLFQEGLGTFRELFTKHELRIPLVVSILVMFAQQFTGCGAVFAYSTDMFISAQLSPSTARFSTLAVGIAYFLFACSAPFLIERLGRRRLSLFQLSMVAVSLSFLSVFSYIQNVNQVKCLEELDKSLRWIFGVDKVLILKSFWSYKGVNLLKI